MKKALVTLTILTVTTFILGALPFHIQEAKDRAVIISFIKENPPIASNLNHIDTENFIVYSGLKCVTTFTRKKGKRKRGVPVPGPEGKLYAKETNCSDPFPEEIRKLFIRKLSRGALHTSKYAEKNWEFSCSNYDDAVARFKIYEKNLGKYESDFHYYFAELLFKVQNFQEAQKQIDFYLKKTMLRGTFVRKSFALWIQCNEFYDNE